MFEISSLRSRQMHAMHGANVCVYAFRSGRDFLARPDLVRCVVAAAARGRSLPPHNILRGHFAASSNGRLTRGEEMKKKTKYPSSRELSRCDEVIGRNNAPQYTCIVCCHGVYFFFFSFPIDRNEMNNHQTIILQNMIRPIHFSPPQDAAVNF